MQPRRPPRAPEEEQEEEAGPPERERERERDRSPPAPRSPSWSREQPPGPGTEQPPGAPAPPAPRPPGPPPFPPWSGAAPPEPRGPREPEAGARPQGVSRGAPGPGPGVPAAAPPSSQGRCAGCAAFSCRTLSHPTFWPAYEPAWARPAPWNSAPRAALSPPLPGLSRDAFFLDPLLPAGRRVPVRLPPQQARGFLRLLLPPPVASPCVVPSRPPRLVWLTAAELVALIGLLQMSMGEPRRGPPEPAGRPARPRRADPYPRRPPDAPGP